MLSLPNDLLIDLLGNLTPSDVFSCRQVCQRLYHLSQERAVWLKIFYKCDYTLPPVNLESLSTADLEKTLLRGEIMKEKWSEVGPGIPHAVYEHDPWMDSPYFLGTMGPYFVTRTAGDVNTVFRWHRLDSNDLGEPSFEYQLAQTCERVRHVTQLIGDSSTMRIAYIKTEETLEEGAQNYFLEVTRISITPSSMNFQVATEASFSIEDIQAIGYDAMCVIVDYVVILRRRIPSMNEERTLMLFHIPTGRAVLATWDHQRDDVDMFWSLTLSHWHVIQVTARREISFSPLPLPDELTTGNRGSPLHIRSTHRILLPHPLTSFTFSPRSPTRYSVFGITTTTLEGFNIELLPNQTTTIHSSCNITLPTGYDVQCARLHPVPPSVKAALGILQVEDKADTTITSRTRFMAFRAELDGSDSVMKLELVDIEDGIPFNEKSGSPSLQSFWFNPFSGTFTIRYVDPWSNGGIAQRGGKQRLRILQYLPIELLA